MAWTNTTKNEYMVKTSPSTLAVDAAIYSETITEDIGGQSIIAGLVVTAVCANVVCNLVLQVSLDDTVWVTAGTIAADVDPESTGTKLYFFDASNIQAPYYRLGLNTAGNALKGITNGAFNFKLSALIPGSAGFVARYR